MHKVHVYKVCIDILCAHTHKRIRKYRASPETCGLVQVSSDLYTYMHIYMHIFIFIYIYVYVYEYVRICIYVYVRIYIYVHVYAYV